MKPESELTQRELDLALRLSQAERKYSECFAALTVAELRVAELEEENAALKKETHAGVVQRWVEKKWK